MNDEKNRIGGQLKRKTYTKKAGPKKTPSIVKDLNKAAIVRKKQLAYQKPSSSSPL